MILGSIRKYLIVATAVSLVGNAGLWYAWKGAEAEQETIRAQAVADAQSAANVRMEAALEAQAEAHEARERVLQERLEDAERVAEAARERSRQVTESLSHYERRLEEAEQASPEYAEWAEAELPSDVVTRLEELLSEH